MDIIKRQINDIANKVKDADGRLKAESGTLNETENYANQTGLSRRDLLKRTAGVLGAYALGGGVLEVVNSAFAGNSKAEQYFRKGFKLAEQGKYESALEMYKKGHDIDPTVNIFPKFKNKQAERLYEDAFKISNKDPEKSLEMFNKALKLEPTNPITYNEIGNVYIRQKKIDKGFNFFKQALQLEANYLPAIGSLGYYNTKQRMHEKAFFWNQLYLVLEPNTKYKKDILKDIEINKKYLSN